MSSFSDQLIGTFMLGAAWTLFLTLLIYTFFYRRDPVYQWTLLAMIGLTIDYTMIWQWVVGLVPQLSRGQEIVRMVAQMITWLGGLGLVYTRFDRIWSKRFFFALAYWGMLTILIVGIVLTQSLNLLIVFHCLRFCLGLEILRICWLGMRRHEAGAGLLFALFGLGALAGIRFVMLLSQGGQFAIMFPSVLQGVGSFGTTILGLMAHLAIHNSQTSRTLDQKREEAIRLARQNEQILREQNATLETKVNERTADLLLANQTKDRLFSLMSHDLRGPIGTFRDSLHLLNQQALSPTDFSRLTQSLTQPTDRLYNDLENMLQWSLSEMNELQAKPQPLPAYEIAEEVLEIMHEAAHRKEITLCNAISTELMVWFDEFHLKAILRNLIDNAIKFTPRRGEVYLFDKNRGDVTVLSVQDSGVGIDPDRLATLFRKTASAPGTNGERGMGVGLRLCRELSERNGGLLYVDSTQGKGSVFQLQLPKFYQQNFRGSTTITQSKT